MILFVNAPRRRSRRALLVAGSVLLLSLSFLWLPPRRKSPVVGIARDTTWARAGMMADLMLSGIEILPSTPAASESYTVHVFVLNRGVLSSGRYAVRLTVFNAGGEVLHQVVSSSSSSLDPGGIGSPGPLRIRAAGLPGEYVAEAVLLAEDYQDEQASNNTLRAKFAVE
ncbi:hypothetical protein [Prosthecochloris sp. CIB 2401]|uniref:hypothetical protein n=1 Tax=Prosthecochloris sp. CIB 2401 TaxID=1868325 RepID=UPI00080AA37C|nr:hypothetical protein [Prosthecochloris sp. CIB 2401]ANT65646.1 hypothetical protein Ptc2401_01915 [Prosthecochloris sp. CIB 2401]